MSPITPAELAELSPSWKLVVDGYGPWTRVDVPGVGWFLKGARPCEHVIVVSGASTTTMESARLLVDKGVLGTWGSVVATEQNAGRGQLRRPWVSPVGNLHASLVMPDAPGAGPWVDAMSTMLPLVAGHMFCEALQDKEVDIRLKWPNDLLQGDRKVGGMLIEERNGVIVLGLGVNLESSPPDTMMREDSSVSSSVLKISNGRTSPLGIWETLVYHGKNVYGILLDKWTPDQFASAMARRLAWLGCAVKVIEGGSSSYPAEIRGVSPEGGLVVYRDGEERVLFSGSILPL